MARRAYCYILEFWYAIRARSYFPIIKGGKEGDLKMTIITRYDVKSGSTLILLKYRSYNDLTERLKRELIQKLKFFVQDPTTSSLAIDPFALPLWHFNATIQYMRRAARLPRDAIRQQEEKAHGSSNELDGVNLQMLYFALRSLDQDKIQMAFIIDTIRRLRVQHDLFYRWVGNEPNPDRRVWVYHRVREELDRYECQLELFKSSVEDVAGKVERMLNLVSQTSGAALWSRLTHTDFQSSVEEDDRANISADRANVQANRASSVREYRHEDDRDYDHDVFTRKLRHWAFGHKYVLYLRPVVGFYRQEATSRGATVVDTVRSCYSAHCVNICGVEFLAEAGTAEPNDAVG